ncbi:orotidine-5'-phosphate decarboxylase [Tistlia consotensis]|uniref:Orotidine-5'-phosphate decarboxylase n=1 Tax=Tistlia consotensis USBA 355 TaxID=560819 RepID=A0A1Y6CES9_9PROT|nr:orotidine 5'-phosphate decarboxylase / HUMPS family protein [Tistlia consotensis]SMF48643.1 orotidine-5'-phosphate decarboxylase [Tistlia consotensis USBA 355]SNR80953.1 orotidine-5'-phosphate decarboxylase [Tistlia consotensis]
MSEVFRGRSGLVPALDMATLEALERVVRATCGVEGVTGYKLGLTAVLRLGLAPAMARLRELTDLPVLYDHQKAGPDMPDMAAKFTAICAEAKVTGLILFPVAGPTAVRQFGGEALKQGLVPVVGGEIPVADYTISGGGYLADDALDRIMADAAAVGVDHFVLPARDPEAIERRCRWMREHLPQPVVFLTGFGPLGGSIAEGFARAGAMSGRHAIVGRLVFAADDPGEAARRLAGEILEAA